jgi:hypothetical protein
MYWLYKALLGSPVELLHLEHFHFHTVSLVQWVNRLLPATGGNGLRPGGAPTLLELGSPVSIVLLCCAPGVQSTLLELVLPVSAV